MSTSFEESLRILAESARYDVSCSSSGSRRGNYPGGIGSAASCGSCHTWSDDSRGISLLKIFLANTCIYDCAYCINRRSNDISRASLTTDEGADLTINHYRRNCIKGAFPQYRGGDLSRLHHGTPHRCGAETPGRVPVQGGGTLQ